MMGEGENALQDGAVHGFFAFVDVAGTRTEGTANAMIVVRTRSGRISCGGDSRSRVAGADQSLATLKQTLGRGKTDGGVGGGS